ncbi:MAG: hypothetical protein KBS84_03870 [Treponema sp.]|nr:hypothetical protein [Candidatus Treponema scatequi]
MQDLETRNILNLIDNIIAELNTAEGYLKGARNWGIVDIFGGGLVTNLIKHSKLDNASYSMGRVNELMHELKDKMNQSSNADYRMNVSGLLTFADFVFDSGLVDVYVETKIISSLDQVKHLKSQMRDLKERLMAK